MVQNRKRPRVDGELHRATIAVLREQGWEGLTLERVAQASGRARSTLWRQGLTLEVLVSALVGELAADFRDSMYPILTIGAPAGIASSARSSPSASSSTGICR